MYDQSATQSVDISVHLDAPDVLDAGKLCLEFANSADWHASGNPLERLHNYNDLLQWAFDKGICDEAARRDRLAHAKAQPRLAAQVYAWAIELREAIYHIFAALASGTTPSVRVLALLNEALPHAFAKAEVSLEHDIYHLHWRGDERGLDSILWPIIRSAVRLLTTGEHDRIGQCADDRGCGYLFYDTSRNRSRRWCDMASCGNRAKSQRHYARHRSAEG